MGSGVLLQIYRGTDGTTLLSRDPKTDDDYALKPGRAGLESDNDSDSPPGPARAQSRCTHNPRNHTWDARTATHEELCTRPDIDEPDNLEPV